MPLHSGRQARAALGAAAGLLALLLSVPAEPHQATLAGWLSPVLAQSHEGGGHAGMGRGGGHGQGGSHAGSHSGSHDEGHGDEELVEGEHAGGKHKGGKGAGRGQGTGIAGPPGQAGHRIEDKVFRAPGHEAGHEPGSHEDGAHEDGVHNETAHE